MIRVSGFLCRRDATMACLSDDGAGRRRQNFRQTGLAFPVVQAKKSGMVLLPAGDLRRRKKRGVFFVKFKFFLRMRQALRGRLSEARRVFA